MKQEAPRVWSGCAEEFPRRFPTPALTGSGSKSIISAVASVPNKSTAPLTERYENTKSTVRTRHFFANANRTMPHGKHSGTSADEKLPQKRMVIVDRNLECCVRALQLHKAKKIRCTMQLPKVGR